jgi:parallel beta-helix repeat protein
MVSKTQIFGALSILIFAATLSIWIPDNVKIVVTKTQTTFCVFSNGSFDTTCGKGWARGGVETSTILNGSRKSAIISNYSNSTTVYFKRSARYDKGYIFDNWVFEGNITNKEQFPIDETHEVKGAVNETYKYEVSNLFYSGGKKDITNLSEYSFGRNMKIEWKEKPYSAKITQQKGGLGTLTLLFRVASDDETYHIRLFDPTTISFSLNQTNTTLAGASTQFSIYATVGGGGIDTTYTFEDAVVPPTGWTMGGNLAVAFSSSTSGKSGKSIKSNASSGDGQVEWINATGITYNSAGNVSFWWNVSSETDYDFALFCIDSKYGSNSCKITGDPSVVVGNASIAGTVAWTFVSKAVSAGNHNFTWIYFKDGATSSGGDLMFLDTVRFNDTGGASQNLSGSIFSFSNGSAAAVNNYTEQTCSGYWGFSCSTNPDGGDNTVDACSSGAGGAGDEAVLNIYINGTVFNTGNSVSATCAFDPYASGDEQYMWYYNGTGWYQLYAATIGSGVANNVTRVFTPNSTIGQHFIRCSVDWDGVGTDTCQSGGLNLYDNDDLPFNVSGSGSAWVNDTWVALSGTGNWSNVTKGVTPTVGAWINYTWYVNATDGTRNKSAVYAYQTTGVDATPPAMTITSPSNNTNYSTGSIWFNLTLNEAGSWAGYSLDGLANHTMSNSSGNWNYNNASVTEGLHSVIFYANDTLGNMNVSKPNITFRVDLSAPLWSLNQTNSTLNGTDIKHSLYWQDVSGLSSSKCGYCNGTWNGSSCGGTNPTYTNIVIPQMDDAQAGWDEGEANMTAWKFINRGLPLTIETIPAGMNTTASYCNNVKNWSYYGAGIVEIAMGQYDHSDTQSAMTYAAQMTDFALSYNEYNGCGVSIPTTFIPAYDYGSVNTLNAANNTSPRMHVILDYSVAPELRNGLTDPTRPLTIENGTVVTDPGLMYTNASLKTEVDKQIAYHGYAVVATHMQDYETMNATRANLVIDRFQYLKDQGYTLMTSETYYKYINGQLSTDKWVNNSWTPMTGTSNWSNFTISVNTTNGANMSWQCWANDTGGYINASSIFTYTTTAGDTTPPTITLQSPTNTTYSTTVWYNITANEALSSAWFSLDGATNITMTNSTGNWNYQNTTMTVGAHNVRFYANDTAGNKNTSVLNNVSFTVQSGNVINACGTLSSSGYYTLVNNISAAHSCIIISAHNIVIDGNGYTLSYATSTAASNPNAINDEGNYNNLTIKNLNIIQPGAQPSATSVYALRMARIINFTIDNVNITTENAEGAPIFCLTSCNNTKITNSKFTTSGTNLAYIYFSGSSNLNISNNIISHTGANQVGIYLENPSNNTVIDKNTIASSSYSIIFAQSTYGIISNNILTSNVGNGLYPVQSSNVKALNNTVRAPGYGIYLSTETNTNITGGSIISTGTSDYYLEDIGQTNNFTDTNFTAQRQIYFVDTTSWFNYNNQTNGNIWLKTNVSSANKYIDRTLINWTQLDMRWNDTASATITVSYNITGLAASSNYNITNGTTSQTVTTDSGGKLGVKIILTSGVKTNLVVSNISVGGSGTPDQNCIFGAGIAKVSYAPTIYTSNPPSGSNVLWFNATNQTAAISLFNCTNNGTASGTFQMKMNVTLGNRTDTCGTSSAYANAVNLTAAYQNIGTSVSAGGLLQLWCKRGYNSTVLVNSTFKYLLNITS